MQQQPRRQKILVQNQPVTKHCFVLVSEPTNQVAYSQPTNQVLNLPNNDNGYSMTTIEPEKLVNPTKIDTHAINDPDFIDNLHIWKIVQYTMTTCPFPGSQTGRAILLKNQS